MDLYMRYCHNRQLRPKTMLSYEQTLKLFFAWIEEREGITQVEAIRDKHIRNYIIELQERGKYTFCAVDGSMNNLQGRRDYQRQVSNGTINNDLRNLRAYFAWLTEEEILKTTPMKRSKPLPEERKPREGPLQSRPHQNNAIPPVRSVWVRTAFTQASRGPPLRVTFVSIHSFTAGVGPGSLICNFKLRHNPPRSGSVAGTARP